MKGTAPSFGLSSPFLCLLGTAIKRIDLSVYSTYRRTLYVKIRAGGMPPPQFFHRKTGAPTEDRARPGERDENPGLTPPQPSPPPAPSPPRPPTYDRPEGAALPGETASAAQSLSLKPGRAALDPRRARRGGDGRRRRRKRKVSRRLPQAAARGGGSAAAAELEALGPPSTAGTESL